MITNFKHAKFLNKSAKVIDNKLVVDLGKDGIKEVPKGDYYASIKFDGVLCAFVDGEILSSSNKTDSFNPLLKEYFRDILNYCKSNSVILIGEIYSHERTFQEIISVVKSNVNAKEVPNDFKFFSFDAIRNEEYEMPFKKRLELIPDRLENLIKVEQVLISSDEANQFQETFLKNLQNGYEGLIIKNKDGKFKRGRTTLNEGIGFKFKPYITDDMEIIGVVQSTVARDGSEKKINELGYSQTSKKKDDRVLIEKASAFRVKFNEHEFNVTIAEDDNEKIKIWNEREKYIGEFVEVKYMSVGSKDNVPRHPVTLRMRWKSQTE